MKEGEEKTDNEKKENEKKGNKGKKYTWAKTEDNKEKQE